MLEFSLLRSITYLLFNERRVFQASFFRTAHRDLRGSRRIAGAGFADARMASQTGLLLPIRAVVVRCHGQEPHEIPVAIGSATTGLGNS